MLDPFMVSGTTGVACRNLEKEFIGIEISEDYARIAQKRISSASLNQDEKDDSREALPLSGNADKGLRG